jgi:hypothetical protein
MEGITRPATSRLDEYRRAHPEISIYRAGGIYYADRRIPGYGGATAHGDTEDELLGKLDGED